MRIVATTMRTTVPMPTLRDVVVGRIGSVALVGLPWLTVGALYLVGRHRAPSRWRTASDVMVAAGCVIVGQLELWAPAVMGAGGNLNVVGTRWVNAPAFFISASALAWRRRAPFVVLAVIAVTGSVQALAVGASQGLGWYLPLLIALYSVARGCERTPAGFGLVLALVAMAVHDVRDPRITGVADVSLFWDIVVVDWAAGRAFRARDQRAEDLEERAVLAERQREEHARRVAAEERERIARELHDLVAHNVSLVIVQCVVALELLDAGEADAARTRILDIEAAGRQALAEMRRLLTVLRPDPEGPSLSPQPGVRSLPGLIEQVQAAGVPVALHVDGPEIALSPGLDLSAYRIVQEALTNTLKHASHARAEVRVRYASDALELTITDDGGENCRAVGLVDDDGGRGLVGIRERVALFGGSIRVGARPQGGWEVCARVPLGAEAE
jgi:signal transduction histidine kinase